MRKIRGVYLFLTLVTISMLALSSIALAAVDKVICVPWQGDINKQHTAISGQAVQLKGVIKTTDTSPVYYKWVFGDGSESGVSALSGGTKYNVATTYAYTAALGTPFTAWLQVSNTDPFSLTKEDPYFLKIEADEINSQINISIDKGLWWLYTQAQSNNPAYGPNYSDWTRTYDGSTAMTWVQTAYVGTIESPTASAVHAFGINNHKINGNPNEDPYVEAVRFGMNYLTKGYRYYTSWPALQAVAIGSVGRGSVIDNPEAGQTSPNGYGIEVYGGNDHQPYQGGQIMDAIIASGVLPTDLTGRDFTKTDGTISKNWTYGELLQDMADMYAWGQSDSSPCNCGICGSWWYNWNSGYPGDNSASQWSAIGMIPAAQAPWNVIVPAWVKAYNANWLELSYCSSGGYFGYNGGCGSYNDGALNTTPSGMIQMAFVGQTNADPKWIVSQRSMADSWYTLLETGSNSWGGNRTYGFFAMAKAMRLALPSPIVTITKTSGQSFDWYYGGTDFGATPTYNKGLAQRIVELQAADGHWDGNLTNPPLTSAWMIITLRPTLFASAPIACFSASPNPSYPDQPITFDPSCSGHSEGGKTIANLKKFEWDWDNDGTYDVSSSGPTTQVHPFACASLPCTYPVTLRVTDDSNPALTATQVVNINITNPPHPPVANAGGPYTVSTCSNDSLALDGSKSSDQDQGQHEAGCGSCPNDAITAWDWDLKAPLTFDIINKTGAKPSVSAADIASFFVVGSQNIGLRVTDNTLLAYPGSGQPNLTNASFGTVDVKAGGICNLAARPKSGKIQLTWTHWGAASYDIYRSTEGPNTGFAKIAGGIVTSYATYLDGSVVNGTTYYYRVAGSDGKGSNAASAKPMGR